MFVMSRIRIEQNITILLPTPDVVQCIAQHNITSCINRPYAKEACFTLGEKTLTAYQKKKGKKNGLPI